MPADKALLRHPLERPLFAVYAILNLAILGFSILFALESADWLSSHPILAQYHTHIRAIAELAILSPIGITFLRNVRHAQICGNSLALSPRQSPQLHEILMRHCRRLELQPPELYYSDVATSKAAQSFLAVRKEYIVLGTRFMQPDLTPVLPVFSFLIGRELGRLRLGHTSWLTELLLTYVRKVPYIKNPLEQVFTYSEDRWGAYLAPEGLAGLVATASGRRMFSEVNVPEFLSQMRVYHGFWAFMTMFMDELPPVAKRIKALVKSGLVPVGEPRKRDTSGSAPSGLQGSPQSQRGH